MDDCKPFVEGQRLTPFVRLSARSILIFVVLSLGWVAIRCGLLWRDGKPAPAIHDEFSYLLGADTFARGKLVNLRHPLDEFVESPHILVRPVYASKYPPGQAMLLALGQKLFGSPFYGVVIEGALMIFFVGLAVSLWVRRSWAIVVSVVLAFYMLPPNYWVDSYWGGSLAAIGGALTVLGVGLDRAGQPAIGGIAIGFGAVILFWTRPYEGAVFVAAMLGIWLLRRKKRRISIVAATAAPVILGALLWTGHYNRAVTGSPFRLPYIVHDHQYNVTPPFWILPLRAEPSYSHPRLTSQHGLNGDEAASYRAHHPWWDGMLRGVGVSFLCVAGLAGYLGFAVFLAPVCWRDPRFRELAIVFGIFLAAMTIETWHMPHYAAPALSAVAIVTAIWLEALWRTRAGRFAAVSLVALVVCIGAGRAVTTKPVASDRERLIAQLSALPRLQLVMVRYPAPDWQPSVEWVYNGADIDGQRVVFAHDLGSDKNGRLLRYYANRQAWLVTVEDHGYKIESVN